MGELYPQQAFTHNIKGKSGIHVLSSNRCYMYGSPTEDVHTDMKAPLIVKDLLKAIDICVDLTVIHALY